MTDIDDIEMELYTTKHEAESRMERRVRKLDLLGPEETLADKIDMSVIPYFLDDLRVDGLTLPTSTGLWLLIYGPSEENFLNYSDLSKILVRKFASREEAAEK